MSNSAAKQNDRFWVSVPVIAIALGIIARIVIRPAPALWEDELIAATMATQHFLGVITGAVMMDMHPPLYFLELHFWSLLGRSDAWLVANSIVFGLLTMASLYWVTRKLGDTSRALMATAVFAVLPVPIWMSGEVRMYAFLSVLLIWMFYVTHKIFALQTQGAKYRIAFILLGIAIAFSHAIGFVAVFIFSLYAAGLLAIRRAPFREWLIWLGLFALIGLFALPQIAKDILYPADMAPIGGFGGMLGWMASIIGGSGYRAAVWMPAAGLALWLAAAILGTVVPRTRLIALCFLIAPIVLCACVEAIDRPLFKTNFFPNLCSPFLALVTGDLLLALPVKKTVRSLAVLCVLAALLVMAIEIRLALNAASIYFRQATTVIDKEKQPTDVVWAPQSDIFWGAAWYLVGPGWGSATAISEPWPPLSRRWKLVKWLGPQLTETLQLLPATQAVMTKNGITVVTGVSSREQIEQARRVWLITYAPRNDIPADLPGDTLGPLRRSQSFSFPPLQVNLYVSARASQ